MIQNLQDLVEHLRANPDVIGLVRYGRRRPDDMAPGGDFDLFVFLEASPEDVESIHFCVKGVPVDLNLRCLDDLKKGEPLTEIDWCVKTGEILHDPTGRLKKAISEVPDRWGRPDEHLTEHDVAFSRFSHQHAIDKVTGRLDEDPLFCEYLLGVNIFWLVQTYFHIRRLDHPGDRHALPWLRKHDPPVFEQIEGFYGAHNLSEKLKITERLTELVLEPIGGPWREDELIAFGRKRKVRNLPSKGNEVFARLFGEDSEGE
jgi:hypothetical protein